MFDNFQPQKVLHLKDELKKKNPKLDGEFLITEKFEGWYVNIYYDGNKFHNPVSSAGREVPAFSWVAERLNNKHIRYATPFIIIAEAYLDNTPFEILNGIFNRHKDNFWCHDVIFKVHDIVPLNRIATAIIRYTEIDYVLKELSLSYFHRPPILYAGSYNKDIWQRYFDIVVGEGGEGIVAKRVDSIYQQGKRNSDLLKLKLECTVDALAVRLEEGFGEKGNDSLTLISKRKNGTEIRTVISRYADKELFRLNPETVIGKVVEIKGMEEYEDGQIRQPVFKCVRNDKDTNDYE